MARLVFAHTMLQYVISNDDNPTTSDYYNTYWLPPGALEGGNDHRLYGGFIRHRPLPIVPGELGAGVSVARPIGGSYEYKGWGVDIDRAKAMGIDGFAPDIQTPIGSQNFGRFLDLCGAAEADGAFKILPVPDLAVQTTLTAANLVSMIQQALAAAPTAIYRTPAGKVLVAPYIADTAYRDTTFWTAVNTGMTNAGIAWALMPMPNGFNDTIRNLFDPLPYLDGYAIWGERNPGLNPSINGLAAAMRTRIGNGKRWMHPVSCQDVRPSSSAFHEANGTQQIRDTWTQAISNATGADDLVQLATWNDLAEGTQFELTDKNPLGTWGRITKRYGAAWKSGTALGTPAVDAVYVHMRDQLAAPTVELSANIAGAVAITSLPVKNTGANAITATTRGFLTVGAKLSFKEGVQVTVSAQPAVGATAIAIQSFIPAFTYGAGTVLTRMTWTTVPPSGPYKPSVNVKYGNPSPSATETVNVYEILTDLTESADVSVTDPGGTRTYTAPAGLFAQAYPLLVGATPTGTVSRAGVPVLTFSGPTAVSATPVVQNMLYAGSVTENPPVIVTPPQVLPAPTRILQAQDTKAALTAANPILGPNEYVRESDTGWGKRGNNVLPWNDLPYEHDRILALTTRPYQPDTGEVQHPSHMVTSSAAQPFGGQLYLMPIDAFPLPWTVQALGVYCTTPVTVGAGGAVTVRLGIYGGNAKGNKPNLVGGPLAQGTITVTTVGAKTVALTASVTVPRGWLAFLISSTGTITTMPSFSCLNTTLPLPRSSAADYGSGGKFLTNTTGSLTTLPTTAIALTVGASNEAPAVGAQAA